MRSFIAGISGSAGTLCLSGPGCRWIISLGSNQLGWTESTKVYWHGLGGMRWGQLVPTLWECKAKEGKPNVVVIHMLENDLVQPTGLEQIKAMKWDLEMLRVCWGKMEVF